MTRMGIGLYRFSWIRHYINISVKPNRGEIVMASVIQKDARWYGMESNLHGIKTNLIHTTFRNWKEFYIRSELISD